MALGDERGELVQFLFVLPLLLAVVLGTVQAGLGLVSAQRLSCQAEQACNLVDLGMLASAADREQMVEAAMAADDPLLQEGRLEVCNVSIQSEVTQGQSLRGKGALRQEDSRQRLSFDVTYAVPLVVQLPGLNDVRIMRHVSCARLAGMVSEIEVGS